MFGKNKKARNSLELRAFRHVEVTGLEPAIFALAARRSRADTGVLGGAFGNQPNNTELYTTPQGSPHPHLH